jgi:hypothetical protein
MFPSITPDALNFTEPPERGFHRFLHGKGANGTLQLAYNGRLQEWLDLAQQGGRMPTLGEFLQFIGELRAEYLDLYEEYLTLAGKY